MTVIHPNSISGITSVTSHSNSLYFYESDHSTKLTINANVNGDVTSTNATFSGDVTIGGTLTYEDVTNIDSVGVITARSGINVTGGNSDFGNYSTYGTRIKPSNGIGIKADGNPAREVFHVTNTTDSSTKIQFLAGGDGIFQGRVSVAQTIAHAGDTNTNIQFPAADTVSVETGGSERLRVDSSGRLLVATTSASGTHKLQVNGSAQIRVGESLILQNAAGSAEGSIECAGAGTNTDIRIRTNSTERLRVNHAGNVGIGTDNPTDNLHVLDSGFAGVIIQSGRSSGNIGGLIFQDNSGNNKANVYGEVDGQLTLSTDGEQRIRIASDGSTYTGGTIITEADMNWGHGTYQRPHIFTGQSGGNPSDAAVVLASPETNPSATRIGSLVFGCKTSSSSGVANSGLKAVINCQTNTNTSDAWKTGAYINFETRLDNGNLAIAQSISSDGQVTKPKQYQFLVQTNGTSISQNAWNKLTGLSIDTNHTTGISDGTYWSNSNQRFTAPVTGTYKFFHGGYAAIAATTNNDRYGTCFRINGGTLYYIAGGNYCNVDSPMNGHTTVYKLNANDYVELWYYSSLSGNWGNGSHGIWWGGYLLG